MNTSECTVECGFCVQVVSDGVSRAARKETKRSSARAIKSERVVPVVGLLG